MGVDLNGMVEVCEHGYWFGVINADVLIRRHYDLFGLLFGVTNYAGFRPLFADRGLPADCDLVLRRRYESLPDEYFAASWVTFEELAAMDWTKDAEGMDERIHRYKVEPDGAEHYAGKALPSAFPEPVWQSVQATGCCVQPGWIYRKGRISRANAREGTKFDLLLQLMKVLADHFGKSNVRLVVFFDA